MNHLNPSEYAENLEQSLIDIAVESWRFARLFGRLVGKLESGDSTRYVNQLRYFDKQLEENLGQAGIRIVNIEGQFYDPGVAVIAINVADFNPEDVLMIEQMLEPIIMDQRDYFGREQ